MAAVPARGRSQTRPSTAPPAVTTCLQTRFGRRDGGTEENLENRIRMADGWGALALFETPQAAKLVSLPLHTRAGPVRGHTSPSLCSFSEVAPCAASRAKALEAIVSALLRRVRHYRLRRGRVLKTLVKRPPPKIGGVLRRVNHSATRPSPVSGSRPLRTAYRERREPGEPVATASRRRARRGA